MLIVQFMMLIGVTQAAIGLPNRVWSPGAGVSNIGCAMLKHMAGTRVCASLRALGRFICVTSCVVG